MKYVLASFCSISELHDTTPFSNSPLGELTNKTRTYSKDPKIYQDLNDPAIALINFYAKDEKGNDIKLSMTNSDLQISVCDWLLKQAKLGKFKDDQFSCLQQLKNNFTKNITFSDIGEMVTNSSIYLPSFLEYTITLDKDTFLCRTWFANEYFEENYPHQEIVVDLPVALTDVDVLIKNNYLAVAELLKAQTPVVVEKRIEKETGNYTYPYTSRFSYMYNLHDNVNNQLTPTYFTILVWGNPNNLEEQILAEIATTILKYSKYKESQWTPIYPDIFNPLEFVCVPHYNEIGLENKTLGTSTFSPIVDIETINNLPKIYAPEVTSTQLIKSLQIVPFMYKSLQISFVGRASNYDGIVKVRQLIPDYQLCEVTSADAGLMETDTLTFIKEMQDLIYASEITTPDNLGVAGINKVTRWKKFYVSKRINKVNYLMVTKYQMIEDKVIES